MEITLLGLDPSLTPALPVLQTLASILEPTQIVYLHETDSISSEITRVVLCATPGEASHVCKWLTEQRHRLTQLDSVAFVEIAEEDSPDSWLLDEQGWLDIRRGPLLAARMAGGDSAAAADFALALKDTYSHTGFQIDETFPRRETQDWRPNTHGEKT